MERTDRNEVLQKGGAEDVLFPSERRPTREEIEEEGWATMASARPVTPEEVAAFYAEGWDDTDTEE